MVLGTAGARPNNALHTERGNEKSRKEVGMRVKNGDGILNSTLVVTKGVRGYCSPSLQAAGATPRHAK